MQIAILIIEFIVVLIAAFIYFYIKGLPEKLHKKNIILFEHDLSEKLETFKSDLTKEIELLKISESQLQIRKIEEFTKITDFLFNYMFDKKFQENLNKNPSKFNIEMTNIGSRLFYFASDETVKKYVEWKKYGLEMANKEPIDKKESGKIIVLFADLVLLMRKDLGYKKTECTRDDFLSIFLTDWDKHKNDYEIS